MSKINIKERMSVILEELYEIKKSQEIGYSRIWLTGAIQELEMAIKYHDNAKRNEN